MPSDNCHKISGKYTYVGSVKTTANYYFDLEDVLFIISVEHDCYLLQCTTAAVRYERQERQDTTRQLRALLHGDDNHYIINTHALHNAHLLRRVLPRALWEPHLRFPDQEQHHAAVAAKLRLQMQKARATKKEKADSTRAANRVKKVQQVELDPNANEPATTQGIQQPRITRESRKRNITIGTFDAEDVERPLASSSINPSARKRSRMTTSVEDLGIIIHSNTAEGD